MAGQTQRGSPGRGRSPHRASSARRARAASVAGPGVAPTQTSIIPTARPATTTQPPATRPLYRLLMMKGLTPAEAANLTAFLCGLPATRLDWSLRQVNQMLFLREMHETGRFGRADGEPRIEG
jgi:hypothetical protein